jgi:hypothetical protein
MSFIGGLLGTSNDYRAGSDPNNPYSQDAIQQQLKNQNQIYGQQQNLGNILLDQTQGKGPNPAQLQYQQNTEQAIQNNAGLLASQRGLNPALAARMASQNAAQMQGQAGQSAAVLQAQQQLASQGQLQNLYGTMGNQAIQSGEMMNKANNGVQSINAGITQGNTNAQNQLTGGFLNAGGGLGAAAIMAAAHGGRIPGKAPVTGDSSKNDIVPTMLSPGEIVIPRSKASDPELAKEFIDHLMSEKKSPVAKESSYRGVLEAHRKLGDAIAALNKKGGKK